VLSLRRSLGLKFKRVLGVFFSMFRVTVQVWKNGLAEDFQGRTCCLVYELLSAFRDRVESVDESRISLIFDLSVDNIDEVCRTVRFLIEKVFNWVRDRGDDLARLDVVLNNDRDRLVLSFAVAPLMSGSWDVLQKMLNITEELIKNGTVKIVETKYFRIYIKTSD